MYVHHILLGFHQTPVGIAGFEPACSTSQMWRDRPDSSTFRWWMDYFFKVEFANLKTTIVTPVRLELTTPSLKVRCSNQLSYEVFLLSYLSLSIV